MVWALLYPQKFKVLSKENIYDLKLETATEGFNLSTQEKNSDTYLWCTVICKSLRPPVIFHLVET